jgi:hypothetical protein
MGELRDQPQHDRRSLSPRGDSLSTTLIAEAWQDAGIDPDDAGEADQWYFQEQGVVVIDFSGGDD